MDRFEAYNLSRAIIGASLGCMPNHPDRVSGRRMCELISEFCRACGDPMTPEQIWDYSPTGGLFMVYEWYAQALAWLQLERALPRPEGTHPAARDGT